MAFGLSLGFPQARLAFDDFTGCESHQKPRRAIKGRFASFLMLAAKAGGTRDS